MSLRVIKSKLKSKLTTWDFIMLFNVLIVEQLILNNKTFFFEKKITRHEIAKTSNILNNWLKVLNNLGLHCLFS